LYDASARVTVDGSLLQVEVYNKNWIKIWTTNRSDANDKFEITKTQ
jgi:hypothetical protein